MLSIASKSDKRPFVKRPAFAAVLIVGTSLFAISAASAAPMGAPPPAPSAMDTGSQADGGGEVQQMLARYGQFFQHPKYGDVWKPTQVSQTWKPFEACNWTYNTQAQAWYYDDKTEWGQVVSHYGRWTLDQEQGWLWVPGSEFSPGAVAWNSRDGQVGWAPLPPVQDEAMVQSANFQADPNLWTYVPQSQFGKGCGMAPPPPSFPARAVMPVMPSMPAPMPMPVISGPVGGPPPFISGGRWSPSPFPPRIVVIRHPGHFPNFPFPRPFPHPFPHPFPKPFPSQANNNPDMKCGIFGQFCKGPVGQQGGQQGGKPLPGGQGPVAGNGPQGGKPLPGGQGPVAGNGQQGGKPLPGGQGPVAGNGQQGGKPLPGGQGPVAGNGQQGGGGTTVPQNQQGGGGTTVPTQMGGGGKVTPKQFASNGFSPFAKPGFKAQQMGQAGGFRPFHHDFNRGPMFQQRHQTFMPRQPSFAARQPTFAARQPNFTRMASMGQPRFGGGGGHFGGGRFAGGGFGGGHFGGGHFGGGGFGHGRH